MGSRYLHTTSKTVDKSTVLPAIPKRSLDHILHYLIMRQLRRSQHATTKPYSRKANAHIIFQYYKSFQLVSRLKGAALCDIKTRYATKKRNPE
jgi:hypothetical protein